MAVSSGRGKKPMAMEYTKEYFDVGDVFIYSPLNDPDVSIVVTPVPWKSIGTDWLEDGKDCKNYCAIYKWCGNFHNKMFNTKTNRLESYKPVCAGSLRTDKTSVFFKEL